MIQLTYQAAFDPFHAIFRLLRLWPVLKRGPLPYDSVRILDFYLLFPFRVSEFRFLRPHLKYRILASGYADTKPYGEQPDSRSVFIRMAPMQNAALNTLAANGMIDEDQLIVGWVQIKEVSLPGDVAERVKAANERQSDLMEFLSVLATEYELQGPNGLKARSGLLEHRYDPV